LPIPWRKGLSSRSLHSLARVVNRLHIRYEVTVIGRYGWFYYCHFTKARIRGRIGRLQTQGLGFSTSYFLLGCGFFFFFFWEKIDH
jgi:hypothetical protein